VRAGGGERQGFSQIQLSIGKKERKREESECTAVVFPLARAQSSHTVIPHTGLFFFTFHTSNATVGKSGEGYLAADKEPLKGHLSARHL